jgi:uncharacterized protein
MKSLIEFILKRSWFVIIGFIVATMLIMAGTPRSKVNSDSNAFQPDHHPILTINDEIKKTFGSSENVIGILDGNIYSQKSLNALRALNSKLETVYGVEKVMSLTSLSKLEEDDGLIKTVDLVGKENLSSLEIAAVKKYVEDEDISLVSKDSQHAILIVEMKTGSEQQKFGAEVAKVVNANWQGKVALSGTPFIISEVNRTIVNDIQVIGLIALGLILFFLYLNFGSVHGVILPLIQVVLGLMWAMGLNGWLGIPFGTLTTIGIIAILAVGSSFSLHLLGRFYGELAHGNNKADALRTTYTQTSQGVIISAVAIAASMLTFRLSDIGTLRDLGLLVVFGVFGALASAMILMPALINVLPQPKVRVNPEKPGAIGGVLKALAKFVIGHRVATMMAALVLVVIGLVGITKIKPNTSF